MRGTGGGGHVRVLPRLLLVAVPMTLFVVACQPGAPGAATEDEDEMPPDASDSLRLRLEAPAEVAAGAPVPITLRVENLTDRTLTLYLTGRTIAFDVVVERAGGARVWRRLEGETVQSILRLEELGPGEALVLEDAWDQRSDRGEAASPGEYRIHGELLTEGEPLVSPAEPLRILPG